jgi:chemotaxis protein CheX
MIPSEEQVRAVVRNIWSTQLGMEIEDLPDPRGATSGETITAAVQISGDFVGGIHLEGSRALIQKAAATMFSLPEDQLTEEDERDVVGELANVVAGNIKALIPGRNVISLPTIVEGTDYTVSSVDIKTSERFAFSFDGEWFVLTVLENRSRSASAASNHQ